MYPLYLTHHTIDEWCDEYAERLLAFGCSEEYVKRVTAELRARWELRESIYYRRGK